MHWMDWYGGWFMMIFWLLLVVVGIVLLVKWLSNQNKQTTIPDSALEILEKRFASGEISKEEFEETKKDLI
ncbi:MAG: SHOCT domain-containing protein [bacterium]